MLRLPKIWELLQAVAIVKFGGSGPRMVSEGWDERYSFLSVVPTWEDCSSAVLYGPEEVA